MQLSFFHLGDLSPLFRPLLQVPGWRPCASAQTPQANERCRAQVKKIPVDWLGSPDGPMAVPWQSH